MKNGDYILVKAPDDYTGKKYRGKYCYEHHLVWWRNTGEKVEVGECIHHRDENKHNNSFINLEKVLVADHVSQHTTERGVKNLVECVCPTCGITFSISNSNLTYRRKAYREDLNPSCSRKCQLQQQLLMGKTPSKTLSTEKILEILSYKGAGKTMYRAAKDIGISKNTVKKYWNSTGSAE